MSVRSSKDDEKEKLCEKVKDIAIKHGFTYSDSADYCGWAPKTGTKLQAAYAKSYKALTSKEPTFCPVHAGLECSIIGHSIKDFDAISIGPNTKGIHSTKEELDIQSFNRTYEVIKIMLGELS
jgi:dipeptidase D